MSAEAATPTSHWISPSSHTCCPCPPSTSFSLLTSVLYSRLHLRLCSQLVTSRKQNRWDHPRWGEWEGQGTDLPSFELSLLFLVWLWADSGAQWKAYKSEVPSPGVYPSCCSLLNGLGLTTSQGLCLPIGKCGNQWSYLRAESLRGSVKIMDVDMPREP